MTGESSAFISGNGAWIAYICCAVGYIALAIAALAATGSPPFGGRTKFGRNVGKEYKKKNKKKTK